MKEVGTWVKLMSSWQRLCRHSDKLTSHYSMGTQGPER